MTLESRLCLLFTPATCRHEPWRTLDAAIDGGVDMVQWRVKRRDLAGATRCREICERRRVTFVVNDDCELAVAVDAAGVHVGQDDTPLEDARRIVGRRRLVGVSTHDLEQVSAAQSGGADYLGFGPVFPTATKGYRHGLDAESVRAAIAAATLPVFAIGGITATRVAGLLSLGVRRIAVSAAILDARDPHSAAGALRDALRAPIA